MDRLRSVRLVGRDAEMERLRRVAAGVRSGEPTLLLIEGEAGIGKTRLVTEALAKLGTPADLAAKAGGFAFGGEEIPFVAVSGVVRALARQVGPAAVLEAGGPAIGVLASGLMGGPQGAHTRGEVLDAFTTMVERLARDRMLWLVFEDLHWIDTSSREVIGYLIRAVGPCQMMALCTRRTHDEPASPRLLAFVAELVRDPRGQRMTLHRLTTAQVAEQVADILAGTPEPAIVESVARRSQGNPFLTEELVGAGDEYDELDELMMARVLRLGEDARLVVQAAAVGDGHAEHSLLARVCRLPDGEFASAVAAATASSVLEVDRSGDGYVFRHALLREAVDSALLPAERKHWHQRWAEELEADPARMQAGPAQIAAAQHWYHTDDPVRAFEATLRAENAAWAMRASPEQARLNMRLIELLPRVPEESRGPEAVRLDYAWTALGALMRSGDWAGALALAERELEQPEATSEPGWRIYLQLVRRNCADQLGRALTEQLDVDANVAELLEAPPNNLVTETLLWYRNVVSDLGRTAQADLLLDRAAEVSDAMVAREVAGEALPLNNPPDGVSTAMKSRSMVEVHLAVREWFEGSSDAAVARVRSLLPQARRPGAYDFQDHVVLTTYATMLNGLGRYREAVAITREAIRLLGPSEANRSMWLEAAVPIADALFALGEWDQVGEWLQAAAELDPLTRSTGDLVLTRAALCCARGDLDAAESWLSSWATVVADKEERVAWGSYRWVLAEVAAAHGDIKRAREHLEHCWALPDRYLECPVGNLLLLAARLEADAPDAGSPERVARIRERERRTVERGDLGRAWSRQLDAELLRYAGSTDPQPWSEAEAAWARIQQPHQQGWALLRQAECLVASSDRSAATASLTRALQIGQRLAARPLVDTVVAVARRSRLPVGHEDVSTTSGSSLTPREFDVLRLLAKGYSNGRIAETLYISPKTASVHVSHILTKLDVPTRTAAAALALRQRLIDEPDS